MNVNFLNLPLSYTRDFLPPINRMLNLELDLKHKLSDHFNEPLNKVNLLNTYRVYSPSNKERASKP